MLPLLTDTHRERDWGPTWPSGKMRFGVGRLGMKAML